MGRGERQHARAAHVDQHRWAHHRRHVPRRLRETRQHQQHQQRRRASTFDPFRRVLLRLQYLRSEISVCGEGSNAFDACTVMRGQKVECTSWPERYAWPERRIQHKTMSDAWHLPGPHSDSESSDKEELPSPPSASGRVLPSSGLASWRTTSMPPVDVAGLGTSLRCRWISGTPCGMDASRGT